MIFIALIVLLMEKWIARRHRSWQWPLAKYCANTCAQPEPRAGGNPGSRELKTLTKAPVRLEIEE